MEPFKVKGKVYPRGGHEDPKGEYTYSSALNLLLDTGRWLTPCPGHFTTRKEIRFPLYRRPVKDETKYDYNYLHQQMHYYFFIKHSPRLHVST
jgi:hypothetical protein